MGGRCTGPRPARRWRPRWSPGRGRPRAPRRRPLLPTRRPAATPPPLRRQACGAESRRACGEYRRRVGEVREVQEVLEGDPDRHYLPQPPPPPSPTSQQLLKQGQRARVVRLTQPEQRLLAHARTGV